MDNDVTAAFNKMHRQQQANIARSFGVFQEENISKSKFDEFTDEQKEIVKAAISDNPFEREWAKNELEKAEFTDIEKSDIMEAINQYPSNSFIFKKTGKEIKDKILSIILPEKQSALAAVKIEVDNYLTDCGAAPTRDLPYWWTNDLKLDINYKMYGWEECRLGCNDDCISNSLSFEHQHGQPKCNLPQTEDECKARCKYNEALERVCRIIVDIKACEILINNLKDEDSIKMTPRQLAVFHFV
jgi:hypothetical protein